MDAKVWTDEFMATKARLGDEEFDHAMMLAWFANAIMAGFDEANRRAQRALDAEREKVKELVANQAEYEKCTDEQITALNQGCLDYEKQIATLQAQLADRDAMILQMGEQAAVLAKENMAVKAQLRQVEGQSKQQAEEAVIVFAKYTTLRQLVEAFRSSEEWGAVKAWMVEGAPTRQEGVEAAKRITKAQYEMENALVGCRQALAAQDAGKEVASG